MNIMLDTKGTLLPMSGYNLEEILNKFDGRDLGEQFSTVSITANVKIIGVPANVFGLRVVKGLFSYEKEGVANPDVTVEAEADLLPRIVTGEVNPMAAFMAGDIRIDGDLAALARLLPYLKTLVN